MKARRWAILALVTLGLALAAPTLALAEHGETPKSAAGAAAAATHADGHGAPAAHGEGHGAGGEHAIAPINWTDTSNKKQPPYLAMLVNFAVLLFIYYKFGKKPVAEALTKRRENVAKQIEEASRIKEEAAQRAKKYQARLETLDAEADQTKAAIRATGEADRERVLREAKEKAARMEHEAHALLDAERKQSKLELYQEAVEAAVVNAEALLRTKLTQADHERLAEDFLSQLSAAKQSPSSSRGSAGGATFGATLMDKRGES